ncbi:MAG: flagellar hook-length control protein FliK [Planctomycetota bacterium]|nr:flagellar hook-length control protein FliK [Planctomycetota bacterium]
MVPFSFESITRSAGLDTLNPFPISESARATHESFESHLQRATAPPPAPATRQATHDDEPRERSEATSTAPPRNEPIRQEASKTHHDDTHQDDRAETTAASEPAAERDEVDVEREAASQDEVAAAPANAEQRATIQELGLEASGDSNDEADDAAGNKLANASIREENFQHDTSAIASSEELFEDGVDHAADDRQINGATNEANKKGTAAKLRDAHANVPESDEDIGAGAVREEAQVAETDVLDGKTPQPNSTRQHREIRSDTAASQLTDETTKAATPSIDAALVESAADSANDNSSRQRRQHQDPEATPAIGNATRAEATSATSATPSRFAQHLAATTGDPNARGLNLTDADQARFVDRVARAVQATGERGGTLRIRLSPPELGSLTLEIKVQGGAVTARVEADTPAARSLLLENLPLLRERLAEHGMRVDQFDVDLTDRHPGGTPDGLQQNDQRQEERPRPETTSHEPDETPLTSSNETSTNGGNEQLNIII